MQIAFYTFFDLLRFQMLVIFSKNAIFQNVNSNEKVLY